MLRAIQTLALSEKISTLFDNLSFNANPATRPVLVQASHASGNGHQAYMAGGNIASRRRRYRRSRIVSASPSIRSSWF